MSTRARAPELELARLLEEVGRYGCGEAYCSGLNAAQWTALRYLHRANRFSRTVSAFALYHGTTRGTASQTMKTLTAKGYLRRRPLARDQRSFHLELTPKARRALEADPLNEYVGAARALPEEQRAAVSEGLRGMLEHLRTRRDRAHFGECTTCRHLREQGRRVQEPRMDRPELDAGHRCALKEEALDDGELATLCVDYEPRRGAWRAGDDPDEPGTRNMTTTAAHGPKPPRADHDVE